MPSIPSRFEVTLFKGDREHKGFGSNVLRFDSVQQEAAPGPGSYGKPKSVIEDRLESTSWGIRGTGGFASRSTRFGARSLPTMPKPGRGVPGPGKYEPDTALKSMKEATDFNQAKRTAVFADADSKSRVPLAGAAPGPGQYSCETRADVKEASAAQAAFKSASNRGVDTTGTADMPGPGEYADGVPDTFTHAASVDVCAGSSFKHPSQPRIARVHRDLPAADGRQRKVLGTFADEVGKPCQGSIGMMARLPGPGHYEQDRDQIWEGHLTSVAGNSGFLPGTKRTDFSQEDLAHLPGPGRYNPKRVDGGMNLTSAASCFNSATDRICQPLAQAPGPAYYEPTVPQEKRSFRLKSSVRMWMS